MAVGARRPRAPCAARPGLPSAAGLLRSRLRSLSSALRQSHKNTAGTGRWPGAPSQDILSVVLDEAAGPTRGAEGAVVHREHPSASA